MVKKNGFCGGEFCSGINDFECGILKYIFEIRVLIVYREMMAEELWWRYADGERDFMGIKLMESDDPISKKEMDTDYRCSLKGFDLRGINLRGAYFKDVDLTKADLTGADLSNAFFYSCTLEKCIIRDANLMSIHLYFSILYEADLRGSNLNYMNTNETFFDGAWLDAFEDATLIDTSLERIKVSEKISDGRNLVYNYYSVSRWSALTQN